MIKVKRSTGEGVLHCNEFSHQAAKQKWVNAEKVDQSGFIQGGQDIMKLLPGEGIRASNNEWIRIGFDQVVKHGEVLEVGCNVKTSQQTLSFVGEVVGECNDAIIVV